MEMGNYLPQLPYWPQLTQKQKDHIAGNAGIRHYKKGTIIHGSGNTCLGMLLILKGGIRVYLLSEEGREVTLFRLGQGECCVLSASCVITQITFDTQMVAEEDCTFLVIHSGVFEKLAEENIYVKCFSYQIATERFSSVIRVMQQILFEKFDRRLAGFLLQEYERTGSRQISMTHEQIAAQVSSAREVVARTLKRFASAGLVEMKRGRLLLKDTDGLKKL